MFVMFPGAANVLPKDEGRFKGPRPACSEVDGMEGLAKLLLKNERLVVLCMDEEVELIESELTRMDVKNTVLGIRAAKGLEFQDVVIVDFFRGVSKQDQAVWKTLFTGTASASAEHPHIELQLKLLYTAITRSCNRLLFVETEKTQLSSVMFRWMVGAGLAEMFNVSDENTVLMTSDEWCVQGIEFALSAEGEIRVQFLEKAVKCFLNAGDAELHARTVALLALATSTARLSTRSVLSVQDQEKLALVVLNGLKNGWIEETKELCQVLVTSLNYRDVFELKVLRQL